MDLGTESGLGIPLTKLLWWTGISTGGAVEVLSDDGMAITWAIPSDGVNSIGLAPTT